MAAVPLLYLQRVPTSEVPVEFQPTAADYSAAVLSARNGGAAESGGRSEVVMAAAPVVLAPATTTTTRVAVTTTAPPTNAAPTTTTTPPTTAPPPTTAAPATTTTTEAPPPTTTTTVPPPTTTTTVLIDLLKGGPEPAATYTHRDQGVASWFGAPAATCAHVEIPKGTTVKVTRADTGVWTTCVINDWGPSDRSRIIDLSDDTFAKLAPLDTGLIDVIIEW